MDSPHSLEYDGLLIACEDTRLVSSLEHALRCAQQGLYHESITILRSLREQLSPDQDTLISMLDTLFTRYINYCQAQQELQQASKHFVEADRAQQEQIEAIEKLLLTLRRGKTTLSDRCAQSPLLPLLPSQTPTADKHTLPPLSVICFGHFSVRRLNHRIALCANRHGQTIMRYLIAQSDHSASIDKLVHALWPEDEMDAALHKLRIAASALRRSLNDGYDCDPGGGYLLCKNRSYQLNPSISLQLDVDQFLKLYRTGSQAEANAKLACYEQACQLYTGPFLLEDLYADWSSFLREQLGQTYLTMCNELSSNYLHTRCYSSVIKWTTAILKENKCDEMAYQQLMRAHAAEGRRTEAVRHYQRCQRVLYEELGIQPMPETVGLFQMIQDGSFSATI
jgi:DNA-binding SARP family transcriptional activator